MAAMDAPTGGTSASRTQKPRPVDQALGPLRFASMLYALAAVAIGVWAAFVPVGRDRWHHGLAEHVAFFGPLAVYALALALAARRVRPLEGGSTAPGTLVYGLLLLHAAIGFGGSAVLAAGATEGDLRGLRYAEWSGTLAGLTWPATLFGWVPLLLLLLGARRVWALLLVAVLGSVWMITWGTQAAMDMRLWSGLLRRT